MLLELRTLLTSVLEMACSNLGGGTYHSDWRFSRIFPVPPGICRNSASNYATSAFFLTLSRSLFTVIQLFGYVVRSLNKLHVDNRTECLSPLNQKLDLGPNFESFQWNIIYQHLLTELQFNIILPSEDIHNRRLTGVRFIEFFELEIHPQFRFLPSIQLQLLVLLLRKSIYIY